MNTLSQLKAIRNGYYKLDNWAFRLCWLAVIAIFAYNYWRDDLWAGIGYAILWLAILFALDFILVGIVWGAIIERKIRKHLPLLISENQLKPNLSYEWNSRNILAVDTENKKVFYAAWDNEYEPIILSSSDIVSVKVRDESDAEAKIKIDGDKVKKTVVSKFDLEIQYKNNEGVVKTLVIPYEKERLRAEEMGRTIGLM